MNYKISLYLMIALLSTSINASESFHLKNTNLTYEYPQGIITGESFKIQSSGITLERKLGNSRFNLTDSELNLVMPNINLIYDLSNDSSLNSFEYIHLDIKEINLSPSLINFSFPKLKFSMQDGIQNISNFHLNCSGENSLLNPVTSCLTKSYLNIDLIKIDKKNQKTFSKTLGLNKFTLKNRLLKISKIKNLKLSIVENKYQLKFYFKFFWNLKFSSYGSVIEHPQSGEVEIKISSFKFLWFDIKKHLIKALKDQNIDNLRIDGNSIFINTKV